ncbi:uncharacterized protein LOC124196635 isoform X1 [Daphnia pulex]|uniref:uncharacterized protein LOC124196635 isoform X1 n=1 Tax=Daphnia pulex TaxID=6669 RepID=UPI001EDCF950|nr:uncharacterized protein LOC124196635 isoform X1 [Daphnia pulex]
MSLFFALYLSLFVLTLSADSVAGISLHQLENQRHSNVEMRELLESKDNQQKALKQKNEILQNLVITLKIDDQNQMQFLYDLFVKAGTTAKPRTITVKRAPTTARSLGDNIPV